MQPPPKSVQAMASSTPIKPPARATRQDSPLAADDGDDSWGEESGGGGEGSLPPSPPAQPPTTSTPASRPPLSRTRTQPTDEGDDILDSILGGSTAAKTKKPAAAETGRPAAGGKAAATQETASPALAQSRPPTGPGARTGAASSRPRQAFHSAAVRQPVRKGAAGRETWRHSPPL